MSMFLSFVVLTLLQFFDENHFLRLDISPARHISQLSSYGPRCVC